MIPPLRALATCFALSLATCAQAESFDLSSLPKFESGPRLTATVRIWGNSLNDLMKQWEDGFHRFQPDVTFKDTLKSTAHAIPALYTGVADLGLKGNELSPWEILAYQRMFPHSLPLNIAVATGAYDKPFKSWPILIFVNRANPLSKITFRQLDGIFGAERSGGFDEKEENWLVENARGPEGNIRTWGKMGLTGDWADQPIHIYGFDTMRNAIATAFMRKVFKGSDKWNEKLVEFEISRKPDGSVDQFAEQQMGQAVAKDRYGITYNGIQYGTPETKYLSVSEKDEGPFVEPTLANVQNRTYPFVRSIYMHGICPPAAEVKPAVKEFLRFILSREGQEAVMRTGEFIPLTADAIREGRAQFE